VTDAADSAPQAQPTGQPPVAAPPQQPHRRRRWLVVLLVLAGIGVAGLVGYLIGDNSRDDDVEQAQARANEVVAQDQAQDQQALDKINQGFEELGNAISQEEAQDDQAAQDAVDQATNDIQSGLEQLGQNVSQQLDDTLTDLKTKINDAVGSASAENAPSETAP
jgi:uncharacterized FlaG/YvyC family protein